MRLAKLLPNSYAPSVPISLRAVILVIFFAMLPVAIASAQETWWVQSADYGVGKQRADVTTTVRKLAAGPNFKVNNTNLGTDPAPGKDKTLHIVAKDPKGKVKEFTYNERVMVPAAMFAGGPGSGKPGWGAAKPAGAPQGEMEHGSAPHGRVEPGEAPGGRGEYSHLVINAAGWGPKGKMKDVTEHVQSMVSNNRLSTKVDSKTMGGDPAPGQKKELIVEYLYHGKVTRKTVPDGGVLHIP